MTFIPCPECSKRISSKAVRCPHCGWDASLPPPPLCDECGERVPEGADICPHCGVALGESYLPDHSHAESGTRAAANTLPPLPPLGTACAHCGFVLDSSGKCPQCDKRRHHSLWWTQGALIFLLLVLGLTMWAYSLLGVINPIPYMVGGLVACYTLMTMVHAGKMG